RLPIFDFAIGLAFVLLAVSLMGSGGAYVLAGALNFTRRGGVSVARKARLHLSLLGAGVFVVLAFYAYLAVPHLLTDVEGSAIVHGASYADVMAQLPGLTILSVVAPAAALLA